MSAAGKEDKMDSISMTLATTEVKMKTGQQVVAINHDNRPRQRAIEVTILGTRTS